MRVKDLGRKLVIATLLALYAGTSGYAMLDISSDPLFLTTPTKPALVMALDDSGSMDSEVIFSTNDGAAWWHTGDDSFVGRGADRENLGNQDVPGALNFNWSGGANGTWKKFIYLFPNGTGGNSGRRNYGDGTNDHYAIAPLPQLSWARSPAYNAQYFDPSQNYPAYPSTDIYNFSDIDPKSAPWDPTLGADSFTVDLTDTIRSDNNNWVFRLYEGAVIPAGTTVKEADSDSCDELDFDDWTTLTTDIVIADNNCSAAIEYFPATFWLPASEPLPADYGFKLITDTVTGDVLNRREAQGPVEGSNETQLMYGYEIKPENFEPGPAYDRAIQQFANWFSYYRKRSMSLRGAIGRAFAPFEFLRVGYFTINNRNNVSMLDLAIQDQKNTMLNWAYKHRGSGGTPNKQAVVHMGEQFERTGDNAPVTDYCQLNFGMLFTDGYANTHNPSGIGNEDGGLPAPLGDSFSGTMADIAYYYYDNNPRPDLTPTGKVPVPPVCDQANPPLWADCQTDLHMNFFAVSMGGDGLIYQIDEDATEDPFANPPSWPDVTANRNASAIDDLWHATLNSRGEMFSARSPEQMATAIGSVLSTIAARTVPSGLSANSTRLSLDSVTFQAIVDSEDWSGDIIAVDAVDGSREWRASEQVPDHTARDIITWNPATDQGIEFDTNMSDEIKVTMLGLPTGTTLDAVGRTAADALINYLRGSQDNEGAGGFRERENLIGDIVNSRPVFSGPGNDGWGRLPDPDGEAYDDYIDTTRKDRESVVYVGANAGMLHGFDAETGEELFAYVPSQVLSKLKTLADPAYSHEFFVDGQINVADAMIGGAWKTVLIGTLGGGGRGIFALDVTDPNNVDVLWEFGPDQDDDVGYILGAPIVTRLGNDNWVVVFGNGYNSASEEPRLFVVDLDTGAALQEIEVDLPDSEPPPTNGLSAVTAWMGFGDLLQLDRVYAGDLTGRVWRFDFDETSGTGSLKSYSGSQSYLYRDMNGEAITGGIALTSSNRGGVNLFFGTGKLLEATDRESTAVETFYLVRDQGEAVETSDLGERKLIKEDQGFRSIELVSRGDYGWYLPFTTDGATGGEHVLVRPAVFFGTLLFSTFAPPAEDVCVAGGDQRLYVLDAASGTGDLRTDGFTCVGGSCTSTLIGEGAPITPPIFVGDPENNIEDTPTPALSDPDNPPSTPPTPPTLSGDPREWCSDLSIPDGLGGRRIVGSICDGRQVWREIR